MSRLVELVAGKMNVDGRALVLCEHQLRRSRAYRLSLWLAVLATGTMLLLLLSLRLLGDHGPFPGAVRRTVVIMSWTTGTLMGWWHAKGGMRIEDSEPWARFARLRGIHSSNLRKSAMVVSVLEVAKLIWVPAAAVALASAASAPSWKSALAQVGTLGPVTLAALLVALVVGVVASGIGRLSRRWGGWGLAALVLVPWMLEDWLWRAGTGFTSIPGLVEQVVQWIVSVGAVR